MLYRRVRNLGVVAVAGLLVLTACGSSGGSGAETTPAPETTPWRTLPPVAGTDTGSSVPLEGGVISYSIKSGDYANAIANRAGGGCSGTDLLDANPELKVLIPGAVMKIPATCLAEGVTEESLNAGEDASESTDGDSTDDTGDSGSEDSDEATDAEDESYNAYIVVSGDYAFGIVKKTGCSYNQLKKANPGKMTKLRPKMKLNVPVSCDTREESEEDSG